MVKANEYKPARRKYETMEKEAPGLIDFYILKARLRQMNGHPFPDTPKFC